MPAPTTEGAPDAFHDPAVASTPRVLLFTSKLGGGGAERQVLRLANFIDPSRFDVSVAVARGRGSYEAELNPQVEFHVLANRRLRSGVVSMAASVLPLRTLIRRTRPDIVCAFLDYAAVAAALACAGPSPSRRPLLVCAVQNTMSEVRTRSKGLVARSAHAAAVRVYGRAALLVALSHGVAGDLSRELPRRAGDVRTVFNAGFDDGIYRLMREDTIERRPEGPLIVACGRLTEQKGYAYLLEAVAMLRRRGMVPTVWVLGEGPDRKKLVQQCRTLGIEGNVRFLGYRENPYSYMAEADVFVLPSLFEGFANVVAEAMAVGTAVVATDCPHGPAEIVGDGDNGRLVPPGQAHALAEAIGELLLDPELRRSLAANGRNRVQRFHARHSALGYEAAFGELLATSQKG